MPSASVGLQDPTGLSFVHRYRGAGAEEPRALERGVILMYNRNVYTGVLPADFASLGSFLTKDALCPAGTVVDIMSANRIT